ncbi:MAG: hypothetical protein WA874_14655 [Chryseosolibacter sp.]
MEFAAVSFPFSYAGVSFIKSKTYNDRKKPGIWDILQHSGAGGEWRGVWGEWLNKIAQLEFCQ